MTLEREWYMKPPPWTLPSQASGEDYASCRFVSVTLGLLLFPSLIQLKLRGPI